MLQLLSIGLFLSASALASPNVGDQARFDLTMVQGGKTELATSSLEILQFDAATDQYLQRETEQLDGGPAHVEEDWKDASEIMTEEKADAIIANCPGAGGTLATITVPAGTFDSCILPLKADDDSDIEGRVWIARVPFGVAHSEFLQKGVAKTMSLRSFARAK